MAGDIIAGHTCRYRGNIYDVTYLEVLSSMGYRLYLAITTSL